MNASDFTDQKDILLNIIVVSNDGKKNVFTDQKTGQVTDLILAVTEGQGFHLVGPRGLIAYAPGSVRRVGFVEQEAKRKDKDV
jgi:hypothetical protein